MRFEALMEQYHDEIFGYLWRLVDGSQASGGAMDVAADAEDLTQEVFLRAYRGFERLRPDSNPRAWLYKIATNCAYTAFKRSRRRAETSLPMPEDEAGARFPAVDETASPYQVVAHKETLATVKSALADLPLKQQAAVVLRHVQGLEYAEIAQALACSEDSARANVYQGLQRLRSRLGADELLWRSV